MPQILEVLFYSTKELHGIFTLLVFTTWEMNILRSFLLTKGQIKFLIVIINYFTTWINAEPLSNITAQQMQKFIWENVVYMHGLPPLCCHS